MVSRAWTSFAWVCLSSRVSWALVSVRHAVVKLSDAAAIARLAMAAIVSSSKCSLVCTALAVP